MFAAEHWKIKLKAFFLYLKISKYGENIKETATHVVFFYIRYILLRSSFHWVQVPP